MKTKAGAGAPILVWIRRDLRRSDHAALHAACQTGRPVIPVFLRDEGFDRLGAAPRWRLGLGVEGFARTLAEHGSALICRSGPALSSLRRLIAETGATGVYWLRAYDPQSVARDREIKQCLKTEGVEARSFAGNLLAEPWDVATKQGGAYKVFTPYWRALRALGARNVLPAPRHLPAPEFWPASEDPGDWGYDKGMARGARVVRPYLTLGEQSAQDRLGGFLSNRLAHYAQDRDFLDIGASSGLSENLSVGEISAAQCWRAAFGALEAGNPGAEPFLRQLAWRDFAYHLMWHDPHLLTGVWRAEWDSFPWNGDTTRPEVLAWQRGRTGIPLVDAGMRELQVTGRMHNRARMVTGSFLTKNLLCDWRIGMRWFEEHLVDWDPACNALGWQWVAGCGPDAAPYFRIFNPLTQQKKFDGSGDYTGRWLAEGQGHPGPEARAFFEAIPRAWGLSPSQPAVEPVVDLGQSRKRALEQYQHWRTAPP